MKCNGQENYAFTECVSWQIPGFLVNRCLKGITDVVFEQFHIRRQQHNNKDRSAITMQLPDGFIPLLFPLQRMMVVTFPYSAEGLLPPIGDLDMLKNAYSLH